ncbi:MAG: hypothetical protein FJ098_07585 [Deltaproteobacteria bacterium]|nr:hypothetical protein [Deltaproteobacteria bacterium]
MDDCLSDCADAMGDDEAQAFMAGLISCMEEAGYDCSARSACAAQAGGGAGYIEGEDVDSKAGEEGSDGDVANGGATGATSTGTGESNSSCSMSGPPQPLPMGPVILLCLAALTVLAVRDSRQRSKGK